MDANDQFCTYPQCRCPFDAPADPDWCAIGLPHEREPDQAGSNEARRDNVKDQP